MNISQIEQIHMSLINGQRRQMTKQIKEYGVYDFFEDFKKYLDDYCQLSSRYNYFTDCVISFNRINER
jgi:hypothetical protein